MAHFTTKGKRYREGDDLASFGALDVTVTAVGTAVEQTAPASLPDAVGVSRGFLYWDTGRRITNKRKVRWTFNHPTDWSEWKAMAWYGVGGGPGDPTQTVDAHWVGVDQIDPTPIDGPGSTFVHAPGGTPLAFPWSGNDHQVRTQWGAANIHAKPHLQRSPGDPNLDFSSWTQLIFGGDDVGYFAENDDDIATTGSGSGVTGIAGSTSPYFNAPMGSGGLLMAGYVIPTPGKGGIFDKLKDLLERWPNRFVFPPDKGDPGPEDILRLKLIVESLDLVRGHPTTDNDAFEGLVGAAKKMSATELKRTIAGTRSTLARGQAALKAMEAMAPKAKPKGKKGK